MIGHSLVDIIVEPARKNLIPLFDVVKQNAINAGALGAGISGSGPTIFALCKGDVIAKKVFEAIQHNYKNTGIEATAFISKVNNEGIKILEKK